MKSYIKAALLLTLGLATSENAIAIDYCAIPGSPFFRQPDDETANANHGGCKDVCQTRGWKGSWTTGVQSARDPQTQNIVYISCGGGGAVCGCNN